MNKTITIIVIIILIVGGMFLISSKSAKAPDNSDTTMEVPVNDSSEVDEMVVGDQEIDAVITHTNEGFDPKEVTIQKGQTVQFVNEADSPSWPASAQHPTHTVYPEKTDGDCLGSAFDACRGLENGESWSFTFNKIGEWFYHDHLRPNDFGKITVLEDE